MSCPTASFCVAVDGNGNALRWNGATWSAPDHIDAGGLTSVSCPSALFCVAVDDAGHALRWNGLGWSAAARIDGSALTGVSCADPAFCMAVDARGDAVRWNGARWSAPARVDAAGFTGVSCASAAFCAAVTGNGDAVVTTNRARRWARVLADPAGGGFTAVSCFAGACVAVDFAGNAVVFCPTRPAGAAAREQARDGGRLVLDGLTGAAVATWPGSPLVGDFAVWTAG